MDIAINPYWFTKRIMLCLIILTCLSSCNDDEEPSMEIFSVEIEAGYLPASSDNWIIVSNTDGVLLDYQELQSGLTILQTNQIPNNNLINVSLMSRGTTNPNINFFSVSTYTGIKLGESWTLATSQINVDPEIGSANVEIVNLPQVETLSLTFSKEFEGSINPQGTVSNVGNKAIANLVVPISQSQRDIMISVNPHYLDQTIPPEFESRYFELSGLSNGEAISLDFDQDFQSYQQQFVVSVPEDAGNVVLDVSGFQNLGATFGLGYVLTSSLAIYPIDEIGVYFNDGFDYYQTAYMVSNNNGSTSYLKVGDAPTVEDLSMRTLDFQIQSDDFDNFSFSADPEFQIIENGWFKQEEIDGVFHSLSWQVYSDRANVNFPVLNNFPTELMNESAVLTTDDLVNTYNRFTYNIDGKSYDDFLDKLIRAPNSYKVIEEVYQLTKF